MARTDLTTPIDPSTIKRVYSGKPGCGCGCRGTYWPDPYDPQPEKNVQLNINRVVKAINAGIGQGAGVQTGAAWSNGQDIYFLETDQRYYWAYTYLD